jgi:hypothetical protein
VKRIVKKISREEFERKFAEVNASWGYEENASLNDHEKEPLFKRMNGEITDEEYNSEIMKQVKNEQATMFILEPMS